MEKILQQIKSETDPFLKAKLLRHLIKEKDLKIIDLAKKLNLTPSYICHFLRLNNLPEIVVDGYYSKMISLSHLFVLSRLKDKQKMIEIYEKVLVKDLTVVQTEELVREATHQIKTIGNYLTNDEKNQAVEKIESLGKNLKAKIIQTRIKSKVIIEIKGSLKETTEILKKVFQKLM